MGPLAITTGTNKLFARASAGRYSRLQVVWGLELDLALKLDTPTRTHETTVLLYSSDDICHPLHRELSDLVTRPFSLCGSGSGRLSRDHQSHTKLETECHNINGTISLHYIHEPRQTPQSDYREHPR